MPGRGSQRRASRYAELARTRSGRRSGERPSPEPRPRAARGPAPSRSQGSPSLAASAPILEPPRVMAELRRIGLVAGGLLVLLLVLALLVG